MARHPKMFCTLGLALMLICAQGLVGQPGLASAGADGLVFSIANGAAEVTGYTGSAAFVAIPREAEGYPVTAIGSQAFKGNATLKDVNLHPAIVSIGEQAFAGCTRLEKMTIPASVGVIGQYAFFGCTALGGIMAEAGNTIYVGVGGALIDKSRGVLIVCPAGIRESAYTVPDGVLKIGPAAFADCSSLSSINLPPSVEAIEAWAFSDCTGLQGIDLPSGLLEIADHVFIRCNNLREISLPAGIDAIGSYAFAECQALRKADLPNGLTTIGSSAFINCVSLEGVVLPLGVTSIGESAFENCKALKTASLPDGMTAVEKRLFAFCESLKVLSIPDSVNTVGDAAFIGCSRLEDVTLPSGLTAIGAESFAKCAALKQLSLPENLLSIGKNTFFECSGLERIGIPASCAQIGEGAFSGCKALRSITLPDSLREIGYHCFWGCESLEGIIIPTSVTSIGEGAFIACKKLTEILIPQGVGSIGIHAFSDCSALKAITLPSSTSAVGRLAFYGCSGLSRIEVAQGNPVYAGNDGVLYDTTKKMLHSYPNGKQESTYTVPPGTNVIGDYAFASCPFLSEIRIPDGVTAIREGAFYECSGLRSVFVPESLTSIGEGIFYGCEEVVLNGSQNAFAKGWAEQNNIAYNVATLPSATTDTQINGEPGIALTQVGPTAVLVTWEGLPSAAEHYVGWAPVGNDFKYYERSINTALIINDLIPGFSYDFYVGLDANFTQEPLYKASFKLREPQLFAQRDFRLRALEMYRCGAGQDFWNTTRQVVSSCLPGDFEGSVLDYYILLTYDIGASQAETVFRQLNALITPSGRVFTTFNDITYGKDALTNYAVQTSINLLLNSCRAYQGGMIPGKYTILYFYNGQSIGETYFQVVQ